MVFSFVIHSDMSASWWIYSFRYLVSRDGNEFFKQESMYAIKVWSFPVWYFFSDILSESRSISTLEPPSSIRNFFFSLFIHSVFLL